MMDEMEDGRTAEGAGRPWHIWLVGVLGLLWNGMGAFDYTMTETRNAAYLAGFTADQLAYFNSFPAWAVAGWALGVWGGVAGCLLILLRRRAAVPVLALSLAGAAVTVVFELTAAVPESLKGPESAMLTAAILIIAVLLLVYAMRMRRRGVLR
nr:hypothetical protein [Sphingomonas sp. SCN 67-18]